MAVMARALDNRDLNRQLEDIRGRTGNTVLYRQGTLRRVLRMLQARHAVAVLIDQHIVSRDAVYVDFFDRPAATTAAVAALALRTGAPVIPVFALPLGGGRYRMIYEHPVEPPVRPPARIPSGSSPSAARTCSRCTCGGIRSFGCGCTGDGGTTVRQANPCAACSRRRSVTRTIKI
jgi:KDO2-lipid IV(A) lauroyltransferase